MASNQFQITFRFGNADKVPALDLAEPGYDVDRKAIRIGDDTARPPAVPTTKSSGDFEYDKNLIVTYGEIRIHDGKTVDGVDISQLNRSNGIVTRIGDNVWANRSIVGSDHITVSNGDGREGDFKIEVSDALKAILNEDGGGSVRFTNGADFPESTPGRPIFPGHLHFNEHDELLYILAKTGDHTFWLDLSTAGGSGGGGGRRFFQRETAPLNAFIGDEWYDPSEQRLYLRLAENETAFWVERRL